MKTKIEPYCQKQAGEFINNLFDLGYFAKEVSRKDMQSVEDLLALYFQQQANSVRKAVELLRKVREL